ncbi:MAG: ABC transporter permease subunit [Euryarchaeota archaeon]|nr:ABC transporter permease subunit [Euryarchaeota archaeon]
MREASGSPGRALHVRDRELRYPLGALFGAIVVWWLATLALDIPPFLMPPPDAVFSQLLANPVLYARNALFTLEKVAYGGSVGIAGGFCLALGIAYLPWFRRAVYPYLVTARVLPKIAIAPLFLIYLGTGMGTAVVFVALIAFFPIVLSTAAGLQKAPREYHDLLDSVDAGSLRKVVYVDLPCALPDIFAGLKQSVTLAVVGAIQFAVPDLLTRLFIPDISPEGFALTVEYLVILSYGYWAIGVTYLFLAGFNAARRTRTSMVASLLQYWAVRLPIAAGGALVFGFGVSAVFWAVTISNIVAAVGLGLYYRYETQSGMLKRATEATAAD